MSTDRTQASVTTYIAGKGLTGFQRRIIAALATREVQRLLHAESDDAEVWCHVFTHEGRTFALSTRSRDLSNAGNGKEKSQPMRQRIIDVSSVIDITAMRTVVVKPKSSKS